MLPAAGVGHEEVEEEVVLSMDVEGTATEHGTLGAVEYPVVGTSRIVPIIGMARQRESLFEIPMRCTDLPRSWGAKHTRQSVSRPRGSRRPPLATHVPGLISHRASMEALGTAYRAAGFRLRLDGCPAKISLAVMCMAARGPDESSPRSTAPRACWRRRGKSRRWGARGASTDNPRGPGRAGRGGGEARTSEEAG